MDKFSIFDLQISQSFFTVLYKEFDEFMEKNAHFLSLVKGLVGYVRGVLCLLKTKFLSVKENQQRSACF